MAPLMLKIWQTAIAFIDALSQYFLTFKERQKETALLLFSKYCLINDNNIFSFKLFDRFLEDFCFLVKHSIRKVMDNTPAFSHMGNKHMQKHMQCFRPLKVSMSWGIYKLMAAVCVFLFVVAAQRGTTKTDSHRRLEALHPCLSSHTAFYLTWE